MTEKADRYGRLPNGSLLICPACDGVCRRECQTDKCQIEAAMETQAASGKWSLADVGITPQGPQSTPLAGTLVEQLNTLARKHSALPEFAEAAVAITRLVQALRLLRNTRGMDELTKEQADLVEAALSV